MKNIKNILIIVLFLFNSNTIHAQNIEEKKQVTIDGKVTAEGVIVKNKKVKLFLADKMISSVVSNEYGNFKLNLEFGRTYYLVIGGDEDDLKWVKVSTRIPLEQRKENHTVQCYIEIAPRVEYIIIATYVAEK